MEDIMGIPWGYEADNLAFGYTMIHPFVIQHSYGDLMNIAHLLR